MIKSWPAVPLGRVVRLRKEFITINDVETYTRLRVQLHAKGVVKRDQVPGALIKTKKQQVCNSGEFLVAEIDAKVGGFGMVPDSLHGSIVSSHYFLFVVDEMQLDRRYLAYFSRTAAFRNQVEAKGSTNYAAIRPEDVLAYLIPLPPLLEQQRIVRKIETLERMILEAQALRIESDAELAELPRSILRSDKLSEPTPMRDLVKFRPPDVTVKADVTYEFAGVYCFGRGVFRGQEKLGMEFAYSRLTTLHTGYFIYPKLMAWEGALGVVPPQCNGCVVSPEFPVFEVNSEKVLPEVLDVYFRDPIVWPKLSGASTGTNVRRRRLNPSDFLRYKMPLPSRRTQEQLREVTISVKSAESLRNQITAELDALLPSLLSKAFAGNL